MVLKGFSLVVAVGLSLGAFPEDSWWAFRMLRLGRQQMARRLMGGSAQAAVGHVGQGLAGRVGEWKLGPKSCRGAVE